VALTPDGKAPMVLGLTELILLLVLPAGALLIAAFCLAWAAFRRVKRLERRLEETSAGRFLRP
jgi:hypothetical protein